MKRIIIALFCLTALITFAETDEKNNETSSISKKEQALLKERKQVAEKMFKLRVKLLENDPELKKLHEKIMELHKELALQLDSKKEMRALTIQIKKIEASIEELKKQDK
jgi:septal ring factor EnvC (AmiA/AmiB activator)